MSRALRLLVIAAACVVPFAPRLALAAGGDAGDAEEEAAAAYDRGASAYDRGDLQTAATELARADELAPNDVTLELALNAAARTSDAITGMTLVERAEKRPHPSQRLHAVTDVVRKRFAGQVGKITVVCTGDPPCAVTVDTKPLASNRAVLVAIGTHRVDVARGGTSESRDVVIEGGKSVELIPTFTAAPSTSDPSAGPVVRDTSRGPSPVWFWIAAGTTIAVGGATALSTLDTASTYDEFKDDRSNGDIANDGRAAERRTYVLGAVTGALAISTALIGLFVVDWRKHDKVAVGPGAMRVRF